MKTIRKELLPFHQYSLDDEDVREVVDTLKSGWITLGPRTHQFEEDFCRYIGSRHAVGVYSCTAALTLSLAGLEIGPGDEVITSPLAYPATTNEILLLGAKPVFVDVESGTMNMDATRIQEKINAKTRAILPVHFAGHPCEMATITAVAQENNLVVIEDAAHAIGAEYMGRKIGAIGDATCFSFYATKNMTTGEGGMLTTNSDKLAERARILRLHGITKDAWKRSLSEKTLYWEQVAMGYKCNMFDLQAALGITQLKKLPLFWERRRILWEKYDAAFREIPEILPLEIRDGVKSAYHVYVIKLDTDRLRISRDEFMIEMGKRQVGVAIHFRSLTLQPYYRERFPELLNSVPLAESLSEKILTLPLYPKMADGDVQYVVDMVADIVEKYRV